MYDYSKEPHRVIFVIDSKSFYASVEAVDHHKNPLLDPVIVVSKGDNIGGGGLVLATSPMAKKLFGLKTNVSRLKDIPKDPRLFIYPPRMNRYITKNLEINHIFNHYVCDEDLHPYSIDESILDLTNSWRLYGQTISEVAHKIQQEVKEKTGIYTTIGIGDNPTQAKIALDLYAKKNPSFLGEIHYETIETFLWPIDDLASVWSIGKKTAQKLNNLGIYTLKDLAHFDPYLLQQKMGVIGAQLYALSWGIDRSVLKENLVPKSKSIGNSQVLPYDYTTLNDLRIVFRELADQVATRIRKQGYFTGCIAIYFNDQVKGVSKQKKIEPTNLSLTLADEVEKLVKDSWTGQTVRQISLYCTDLTRSNAAQGNLFLSKTQQDKEATLENSVDEIRKKFGFTKLVHTASLKKGGTAIKRAGLVGGHAGGNSYE
ncbi:Y-family DNA polymerase [Xylocopilactobacillus apicola]|uniref:Type VI secretion protein ImpB n=1 Tax=Xylocopilactobacillus apicola TaxID=2932184 RepID=A0AAU9D1L2_9LACO|nr:Y-family DNA polymerase [Xylocopilactobacillus apicola]BDR58596.1 type VI secretion protein ImpB [Xylocopilactobacillus apicola]